MKKIFLLSVLLVIFLSACGSNTWVLEKERLSEDRDIEAYVKSLQQVHTDFRGYNVITIAEGSKMVVVSTGTDLNTLEFKEADISDDNTVITVEELDKQAVDEENSFILIGIDEIKGELTVVNTNGEEFLIFE